MNHWCRGLTILVLLLGLGTARPVAAEEKETAGAATQKDVSFEMKQAFEKILAAAKDGNADAQLRAGMFYFGGDMSAPQDYDLALHWFRQAAKQGKVEAMYQLGLASERGLGGPVNLVDAMSWYRQAAAGGSVLALRAAARVLRGPTPAERRVFDADRLQYEELAATSLNPDQVKEYREKADAIRKYVEQSDAIHDLTLAAGYSRQAAAKGDPWSRREWARALLLGQGVEADPGKAVELLEPLARSGDAAAQLLCADAFSGQFPRIPADYDRMFEFLWQAASAVESEENAPIVAEAMTKIAWCYDRGIHVAADEALAVKWYEKAAERGAAPAMVNLGHKYAGGDGVPQSDQTAFEWYRKAARADHPLGWFNLGICYAAGRGVPKDDGAALKAFRIAAGQGVVEAQYNLARFYLEGRGTTADPARAARWFTQAAEQGDGLAMVDLAQCYLDGRGVPQDRDRARHWLDQAAKHDAPMARELLDEHFGKGGD